MKSMADIKHSMRAVQDTSKITKAMYLISTAKVRKALNMYESNSTYFTRVQAAMKDILMHSTGITHPYLGVSPKKRPAFLVIAADKGLCGGYNHNLLDYAQARVDEAESPYVLPVGQETLAYFQRHSYGIELDERFAELSQSPTLHNARKIMRALIELYEQGKVDSVFIIYTKYFSATLQKPLMIDLVPLSTTDFTDVQVESEDASVMSYYPSVERVFDTLVPQYIVGIVYATMVQAYVSEQSARMNAMDSANRNGREMLDNYTSELNTARQSAVTSEIAEIIGALDVIGGEEQGV